MENQSLKIKLISPKMSLRPMDSEFKRRMAPSLSLVTLASLTPKEHYVYIEDENLRVINYDDKPDVVGITVNIDTTYRAFEISDKFRKLGSKVIFGGIHASANPEMMLDHCDSVCIGEAEEIWETMLNDLINGRLQRIYYNKNITDLTNVPISNWNFISKNDYLYNNIIITSRGCPFKCDFCYNSCDYITNPYRNRPIASLIEEINTLDTKQIMFIDDNLIGNIAWINEFLEALTPLKVIWHSAVSANLVHYPELIKKMAASGCRSLFIGFESINPDSIKSANKMQNKISDYEKLIKTLHDSGIMVNASLVFGFDDDTMDTFPKTLDWLISNKIESMTAHILTPYPGTKFYKKLRAENRIIDNDFSKYNTSNVVFAPKNMTPDELRNGYIKIYEDFYSIKNIFKRKPNNSKILAPFLMFNLIYRKYGKFASFIGRIGFMHSIGKLARKLSYGID